MNKEESDTDISEIKYDLQILWDKKCLPNMFIYGPDIKLIHDIIMSVLNNVYKDFLHEALLIVDTDTDLVTIEHFCKSSYIFKMIEGYFPKIILIQIHHDSLKEHFVCLLEEYFETWDDTCRVFFISSHYYTLPYELSRKLLCFMI